MRIQHNIMAMNAFRNYNTNTSALGRNLEKLSSGYKINRAGDDAAGLAISEKMRAQISGLKQAQSNVKDGISLVKTAEGALQEVQDMMNRMVTLATQSANGTYDNDVDRDNLQKEVEALATEIDRITDASNFNGKALLNGDLAGAKVTVTDGAEPTITGASAAKAGTYEVDLSTLKFGSGETLIAFGVTITEGTTANVAAANDAATNASAIAAALNADGTFSTTHEAVADGAKITVTAKTPGVDAKASTMTAALTGTVTTDTTDKFTATTVTTKQAGAAAVAGTVSPGTGAKAKTEIDFTDMTGADVIGGSIKVGSNTYNFVETGKSAGVTNAIEVDKDASDEDIVDKLFAKVNADTAITTDFTVTDGGKKLTIEETTLDATVKSAVAVEQTDIGGLNLQIGDTADSYNQMKVQVGDMHTVALKIDKDSINVKTQTAAADAIAAIKTAINTVSSTRGDLGAIQNRLEHTTNNLAIMTENIQDAESTIRDVDIADEMTSYTKNNILLQSAQAMLAQANQMPQGVLQLLQ